MSGFRMKAGLAVAIAMAIASLPSSAAAQRVAPPGNPAVDQYTESLPTPGGSGPSAGNHQRSPAKVLGSRNAGRLAALGSDGQAAAMLAAAGAPIRRAPNAQGASSTGAAKTIAAANGANAAQPGGSSGLGEIVSQATGSSSSGEMGLLLPLLIGVVAASSIGYLWHRRRRGV